MKNLTLGLWRHYKGEVYEVLHVAKKEGTLEDLVVYKGPFLDINPNGMWVRPLNKFVEKVYYNGSLVNRFEKYDNIMKEDAS